MPRLALIAYKAGADLGAKAVMFVITVLAARRLSAGAFGVFSLASTLGWMLAVVSDFGIQLHVAREVARHPGAAAGTVRQWWRVRVGLAVCAAAVAGVALAARPSIQAGAQALIVAAYLATGLVEFLYYVLRGLSRADIEASMVLAQRGAMLVLAGAVLVFAPRLDLLGLALAVPALVFVVVSYRVASTLLAVPAGDALRPPRSPVAAARRLLPREFLRDVAPIGAGIVLSALYFRIDVFLIEAWIGVEAVARYSAVFRLVDALRLFPAAVLAVVLPALSRASSVRPLVRISTAMTLFAIAVSAVTYLGAPWIVSTVYGPRYVEAAPAFQVLALAFPLLSLNYALTHQLILWKGHLTYAAVCAAALAANVLANIALIPSAGIAGAAWATILTEVVVTMGCVIGLVTVVARQSGQSGDTDGDYG